VRKARSDSISLQRAPRDSEETGAYTFERLESVVAALVDSRRQLQAENANLRKQLHDQGQRLQGVEDRLLGANQRRQDALKRIDDLIARLDQIDLEFGAKESLSATSSEQRRKRAIEQAN
jgi:hypothetical protein